MPAIRTRNLTHYYGSTLGIKNLNLTVPQGSIYGLLGANGAGKTTLIRLLLGLISPGEGQIQVLGSNITKERTTVLENIGYLPGELKLYPDMTGKDLLDLFQSFYPEPAVEREHLLSMLDFRDRDLRRPFREYSLGMKQKLGIIQALQHRPQLAILDEPTTGLDPLIQRNVHNLLADINSRGTTVFMSSHNLQEVERCCEYAAIVSGGHLVASGTLQELKKETQASTLEEIFFGYYEAESGRCDW